MILAKKLLACGEPLQIELETDSGGCGDPVCCSSTNSITVTVGNDSPTYIDNPERDLRNAAVAFTKAADKYDTYLAREKAKADKKKKKVSKKK